MLTFVIGLLLGLLLALTSADQLGGTRERAEPTDAIGPNITGDVIPFVVPGLIRIYDDDGALLHEWSASRYGLIGWTRRPELFIFFTSTASGGVTVAGDPSSGALYELTPPEEIVQPQQTEGYPDAAGAFRVAADGVRLHGELLLADRGLEFSLLASPSGRWVAVRESQPSNTHAIWSVDARGGVPAFERLVDYAELPLDFAEGNPLSPNRRWFVTNGTVQTILRRADGLVKILPVGSFGSPLWREDGSAFLLNSTIGDVLVDLPEATLRVIIQGFPSILSWEDGRIFWFAPTYGSDE